MPLTPADNVAESIILDPTDLTSRGELDLTPWIAQGGVDWGDAAMTAYMAEQAVGSAPVDYRIPNRQITIPLIIREYSSSTFEVARQQIQAKIGLWQAQGGYLKRCPATGGTVYCDVVSAQLHLSGDWMQAHRDADLSASITLEAIPDFYGAEETLSDHTETTLPEITFTETTTNGGDFPLGDRVRVVVDEDQAQSQRGLMWAWRGRHYSSASTATSVYEAEALTILDTATRVAKGGASGGTVVTHGTISTSWTPVVGTNLTAGNYLTHTGTNRLYARVYSASGTLVQARAVWDVGDLVLPSENDAVRLYDGGTFHILDLGEARLDPPPTGAHRWQGQIQAKGDVGNESFSVDRVWIANRDESAGVLSAPVNVVAGATTFSARDEFNQTAGALTGKTAAVGGVWVGAGDADDFSVETTGKTAQRTALADASGILGRFAISGVAAFTTQLVQVEVKTNEDIGRPGLGEDNQLCAVARYVDVNNWFRAALGKGSSTGTYSLRVEKCIAGVLTKLTGSPVNGWVAGQFYVVRLLVFADGTYSAWVFPSGGTPGAGAYGYDSTLATGGALASGKPGFLDTHVDAAAATRNYDNFAAWVPASDAVAFASQSVELGTQGIIREDSGGTAYGPVSVQTGDIPRMPNRSSAGTVEFMGKLSRGDLTTINDPGIDDVSARVYRRASHLLIPG